MGNELKLTSNYEECSLGLTSCVSETILIYTRVKLWEIIIF